MQFFSNRLRSSRLRVSRSICPILSSVSIRSGTRQSPSSLPQKWIRQPLSPAVKTLTAWWCLTAVRYESSHVLFRKHLNTIVNEVTFYCISSSLVLLWNGRPVWVFPMEHIFINQTQVGDLTKVICVLCVVNGDFGAFHVFECSVTNLYFFVNLYNVKRGSIYHNFMYVGLHVFIIGLSND